MTWFVYMWLGAFLRAVPILLTYRLKPREVFRFSVKAANLSINFAGFSNRADFDLAARCARLGIMSSLYDVVSDHSRFRADVWDRTRRHQARLLSPHAAELLDELLAAKRRGEIGYYGLDRGISAVKIIITEFGQPEQLEDAEAIERVGRFCQVADDLIDFDDDAKSDHLNYLKTEAAADLTRAYVEWDFEPFFRDKPRALVLRYAFRRAKRIAETLLASRMAKQSRPLSPQAPRTRTRRI